MNDYISREAVLSKCQQIWTDADETTEIGVAIINIVDELAEFVENVPSANVQPVKCGRWIRKYNTFPQRYFCTECGEGDIGRFAFCHHCGVKMDLKEGDK